MIIAAHQGNQEVVDTLLLYGAKGNKEKINETLLLHGAKGNKEKIKTLVAELEL